MPSPYGRQRPRRILKPSPSPETSSSRRRDFPTPASPTTVARRHTRPSTASRTWARRSSSSSFAPDQWRVAATRSVGVVVDSHEPVRRDALRLALQLERLDLLDVDVVPHEAVRQVTEQDLLRAGGLLETRGDVDGVSRDEPLSGRRIAGDHRARVHAGANRQADAPAALEFVVQDRLRPLHVRGRADGAQRVVLVQRSAGRTRP